MSIQSIIGGKTWSSSTVSALLIPVAIFLLNIILKSLFIDSQDVAMDEPFSIFYAQHSIPFILEYFSTAAENNPPLYHIFLHYWIQLFGISAFSVRMLSTIFSALTAVVIYQLGVKFFNRPAAFASALVFSFSTMHIYFAHEARTYTLFALLNAVILFSILSLLRDPQARKHYYRIVLANIILIYSHYFGFIVIGLEVIILIIVRSNSAVWKKMFIVLAATIIAYIPFIPVLINRYSASVGGTWVAKPDITHVYGFINLFLNSKISTIVIISVIAIGIIIALKQLRLSEVLRTIASNKQMIVVFSWFIIPYLSMFFVSFWVPMFIDRYILFCSVPLFIFVLVLISLLFSSRLLQYSALALVVLSLIVTVELNPSNNRNLREVVEKIKKLKTKDNLVFISPVYADYGFTYYYNQKYFEDYRNNKNLMQSEGIYPVNEYENIKDLIASQNKDIIYLQAGNEYSDPDENLFLAFTKSYAYQKEVYSSGVYQINIFSNQ